MTEQQRAATNRTAGEQNGLRVLAEMKPHPPQPSTERPCSWCLSTVGHLASCELGTAWNNLYWSTRPLVENGSSTPGGDQ